MSKPGADPTSGMSLGDALRLPKRHPACRRREAQPGSCVERENLDGDAKGEGTSGSNREAESTDAAAPMRRLDHRCACPGFPAERAGCRSAREARLSGLNSSPPTMSQGAKI